MLEAIIHHIESQIESLYPNIHVNVYYQRIGDCYEYLRIVWIKSSDASNGSATTDLGTTWKQNLVLAYIELYDHLQLLSINDYYLGRVDDIDEMLEAGAQLLISYHDQQLLDKIIKSLQGRIEGILQQDRWIERHAKRNDTID